MSPAKSLQTVLRTLAVCLFLIPSAQSGQSGEASAAIRASATVVNPTGLTLFDSSAIRAVSSELGFETDNLHQKPADAVLVHFPPKSSVLLMLEAEGKLLDQFSLSESANLSNQANKDSRSLSGGYLLERRALTESLPVGTSNCTVTLIHTGS